MRWIPEVVPKVVVLLTLAAPVMADTTWTGGGDGTSWFDAANWGGTAPDGQRRVFINGTANVIIDASVNDTFNRFLIADGGDSDDVHVHMTGGNINIAGGDDVQNLELGSIGFGSLRLSGGTMNVAGRLRMATDPPPATPRAELIVDGGNLIVGDRLFVGFGEGAEATLRMESGSITAGQIFVPDWVNGRGQILMTGGTITTNGLWVPTNLDAVGAHGHVQLDGGTIFAGSLLLHNSPGDDTRGRMDITGGRLVLPGDMTADATLLGYISDGVLTAFGGAGTILLNYDPAIGTEITAVPEPAAWLLCGLGLAAVARRRSCGRRG